MAKDSKTVASTFPVVAYRFKVTVGDTPMAFSTVSGLEQSVEKIEYKDGLGGLYQFPGQQASLTLTLKRGIVPKEDKLLKWMTLINGNQVDKRDISISLMTASGQDVLVTWNVSNAFPTKLSAPNFDASSNEVAFEEMTLSADRLEVMFH
ncbi:phage tail protein [Paraburkholderia aspalathi]|uniref:phage tail protein n=1 Tax=Paraburkholderia aspalathi TaxID=1324617 RepID=UPI0038B773A7